MDSMEHRYRIFRDFSFEENIRSKYEKLEHFLSLLYYLYVLLVLYRNKEPSQKSKRKHFSIYIFGLI